MRLGKRQREALRRLYSARAYEGGAGYVWRRDFDISYAVARSLAAAGLIDTIGYAGAVYLTVTGRLVAEHMRQESLPPPPVRGWR